MSRGRKKGYKAAEYKPMSTSQLCAAIERTTNPFALATYKLVLAIRIREEKV